MGRPDFSGIQGDNRGASRRDWKRGDLCWLARSMGFEQLIARERKGKSRRRRIQTIDHRTWHQGTGIHSCWPVREVGIVQIMSGHATIVRALPNGDVVLRQIRWCDERSGGLSRMLQCVALCAFRRRTVIPIVPQS